MSAIERWAKTFRELVHLLVKERRVEQKTIVAHIEAGALFANAALAHHSDDLSARHRFHEHRPLLERGALRFRFFGVETHRARCSFHQANASAIPTSGVIVGDHASSRRARSEVKGLSRVNALSAPGSCSASPGRRATRSDCASTEKDARASESGIGAPRTRLPSPSPA